MPLELAQIEAADDLWERLDELRRSDRAIAALQGSLSGFDHESTLLKVLALHPIDTSKTHVGLPLAREIHELMQHVDPDACTYSIVDALAAVADRHGKSSYDGVGFASRFAHHFVDNHRFPVLDAWSERALEALVGGDLPGGPGDSRYTRFAQAFARVAEPLELTRRRRLGRWLWLAGQYTAWLSNRRTAINRAVRELFEKSPEELAQLLPAEMRAAAEAKAESTKDSGAGEPPPALPSRAQQDAPAAKDAAQK